MPIQNQNVAKLVKISPGLLKINTGGKKTNSVKLRKDKTSKYWRRTNKGKSLWY